MQIVLLLHCLSIISVQSNPMHPGLRILGGEDVPENDYPYIVRIESVPKTFQNPDDRKKREAVTVHVCTGTVLSGTWTITAAHCIDDLLDLIRESEPFGRQSIIRFARTAPKDAADTVRHSPDTKADILDYRQHPAYRDYSFGDEIHVKNDMGLLYTEPFNLQQYAKISGIDFSTLVGMEAQTFGYGVNTIDKRLDADAVASPNPLQILDVLVVSCPTKGEMYPAICVAARCNSDRPVLCAGDAGGPLIHPAGIIGIISRNGNKDCRLKSSLRRTSLKCGHVFHLHCCKKVLANKWIGPRITFSFSQCPICKEDMDHWTLEELLAPIRGLYDEVKRKALMRLEYEGCALPGGTKGKALPDPATYAMDRYAYYVCHKCGKAYFGGLARCEAETSGWWEPAELVCGACSDVAGAHTCPKHGADFLEYKCRYCCSVAVFFCFGTSHFCNSCHDDFQRVTSIPKHLLPHCPAGPKCEQLPGSADECPLQVQHPATGEEFALGCGVCRHAQAF